MFILPALGARLLASSGTHTRGSEGLRRRMLEPSTVPTRNRRQSHLPLPNDPADDRSSENRFLYCCKPYSQRRQFQLNKTTNFIHSGPLSTPLNPTLYEENFGLRQ